MENKTIFYSNGKLLITAEYLILDGAKGFALPTKFGQSLAVEKGKNKIINWKSLDKNGKTWFESSFSFSEIECITNQKKNISIRNTLLKILQEALFLNPTFFDSKDGFCITSFLNFPRNWGLGTSSTLINNIAQWFDIDAFCLLKNSFGGSGYDIACAQNNSPILYWLENEKPIVKNIIFNPNFVQNIYFVYLGKKQNSKKAIATYRNTIDSNMERNILKINKITHTILNTKNDNEFILSLNEHETMMSKILKTQTIKERLFPDFKGAIKSLGAWGGDFILVFSNENPLFYFKNKGYSTVLSYKEMIL